MSDKLRRIALGENATKITSAQGAVAGPFDFALALTDCTFTANTNWTNASNPESITISAGQQVPGVFTNITVSSGTLLAI